MTSTRIRVDRAPDGAAWRVFLLAWLRIHGTRPVTARTVRASAEALLPAPSASRAAGDDGGGGWAGTFPRTNLGELPSVKSLGRRLTARLDWQVGEVVLRSVHHDHTHMRLYWVEHQGADQ